jgi:(S)-2-hydroxyglutarate dehydrogenase
MSHPYDLIVVGGGIVGLATAYQYRQSCIQARIAILEKEAEIGLHQTGRNSGVVHSGIYYKPGSLKAKNCVAGAQALLTFCDTHGIPYERCGKLIVATEKDELPRLNELEQRGQANGVKGLRRISQTEIRELEPAAAGIEALFSPYTAIVDFKEVAKTLLRLLLEGGAEIFFSEEAISIKPKCVITKNRTFEGKTIVNCSGLYSDRLGRSRDLKILPFRGEYYQLKPEACSLVKGLIYPVPDPSLPFLGVHLNRTIRGNVEAGPNAVLAFSREGYQYDNVSFRDLWDAFSFPGFWKLTYNYWKVGAYEFYRSLSKQAFLRSLQKLVPSLKKEDLILGRSGVRAQVVSRDGSLCDDFCLKQEEGVIHVLNAPSPAATSSLAIGKHISKLIMH